VLRTIDDALTFANRAGARRPGRWWSAPGFIGAEIAATCRGRGLDVTVLEALPMRWCVDSARCWGAVLASMHRDHGVDLRTGVGVAGFEGAGRVERVLLDDGTTWRPIWW